MRLNANKFVRGTLLGAVLGVLSTLIYQNIARILNQPRLKSRAVLTNIDDFENTEKRAFFIAAENLRAGIENRRLENGEEKRILHAGYRNFRESWGRDFAFASFGLLALKEFETVRDTLDAFFYHQKPDGQLPVKLKSMSVPNRYLHSLFNREQSVETGLTPKYITGHRTPSLDGQALLIIAATSYIFSTQDHNYAIKIWNQLQQGIIWLKGHSRSETNLLYQQAYADWADSVARKGAVLYTNVVYWKALQSISALAEYLSYRKEAAEYHLTAKSVREEIREQLWRPQFGHFATSQSMENLSSAGNLLAIAWRIADETQSLFILSAIQSARMAYPVPTQAAFPEYNKSEISLENRVANLANYHTTGAWLWIGAWHVISLCRTGQLKQAKQLIQQISAIVVRDQQVHEVYGLDARPLSTFWYTSEAPLTWNAGMIIYAFKVFEEHKTF